jgi:hypothetical protein
VILTVEAPPELVLLAPAITSIVYVGEQSLPIDGKHIAVGLDDALLVSLEAVASDASGGGIKATDVQDIAERVRCAPRPETLQRILAIAHQSVTTEVEALVEAEGASRVTQVRFPTRPRPSDQMATLLIEMDLAKSAARRA